MLRVISTYVEKCVRRVRTFIFFYFVNDKNNINIIKKYKQRTDVVTLNFQNRCEHFKHNIIDSSFLIE